MAIPAGYRYKDGAWWHETSDAGPFAIDDAGVATLMGGGGGGGGGGAVTVADGADVTQGAKADAAAAADTSTASLISLIKRLNQNLTTINTTLGTANTQLPPSLGTQSIANSLSMTPATSSSWAVTLAALTATAAADANRLPVDERDGVAVTTTSVAAAAPTATATFTNGSPNIGWTAHGFSVGKALFFTTSGTLPTNFSAGSATTNNYYVVSVVDANTFTVAATPGGTAITAGSAGSGTQTGNAISTLYTQDMTGYESLSNQITSAGTTCTVTYETSDDAQNWVAWQGLPAVSNSGTGNSSSSTTAAMTKFGKWGKYGRARVSTYTSGTVTGVGTLHKAPFAAQVAIGTGSGFNVGGTGAHAAAVTGNPTMMAVEAYTAAPVAVTTGQTTRVLGTVYGAMVNRPYTIPELEWSYAAATGGISNTTTAVTIVAAAGAGLRNYLTGLQISSDALGAATEIAVRDGAGGTVIWRTKIGTSGYINGYNTTFPVPLKSSAATLLEVVTLTASITGAVFFNAQGFIAP